MTDLLKNGNKSKNALRESKGECPSLPLHPPSCSLLDVGVLFYHSICPVLDEEYF